MTNLAETFCPKFCPQRGIVIEDGDIPLPWFPIGSGQGLEEGNTTGNQLKQKAAVSWARAELLCSIRLILTMEDVLQN